MEKIAKIIIFLFSLPMSGLVLFESCMMYKRFNSMTYLHLTEEIIHGSMIVMIMVVGATLPIATYAALKEIKWIEKNYRKGYFKSY